jgi:hypothetical protein
MEINQRQMIIIDQYWDQYKDLMKLERWNSYENMVGSVFDRVVDLGHAGEDARETAGMIDEYVKLLRGREGKRGKR